MPEGGKDERQERVSRARNALQFLKQKEPLQMLSAEDRKKIIEASRQVIQQELDAVAKELQTAAGDKLKALEKRQQAFFGAKTEVLALESQLSSLAESVGVEARELKLDWRDLDKKDKAILAAIGAASAGAAFWLWSKVWGKKENPGLVRRLGGLLLAAGAAFAGIVMLRKRGPKGKGDSLGEKMIEKLPPEAQTAVGVPVGIGAQAAERATDQLNILKEVFLSEGVDGCLARGWIFVKGEAGWVAKSATDMFTVPLEWVASLDDELSSYRHAVLYGKAGIAYVLGHETFKAVLAGKIPLPTAGRSLGQSLAMTAGRAVLWPATAGRDVWNIGVLSLTKDGHVVAKTALKRLALRGRITDWHYRRMVEKKGTEGVLQKGLRYFQEQNEVVDILKNHPKDSWIGGVSGEYVHSIEGGNQRFAKVLSEAGGKLEAEYVKSGKPIPEWLNKLKRAKNFTGDELHEAVNHAAAELLDADDLARSAVAKGADAASHAAGASRVGNVFPDELRFADDAYDAQSAARVIEKTGDATRATKGAVPAKVAAKAADATVDAAKAAKGASSMEKLAEQIAETRKAGKTVTMKNVAEFLADAQKEGLIDKDTLRLLGDSEGAKKIIVGAIKTGDLKEVSRVLSAAKNARAWRIVGNAAGVVVDPIVIGMAYADWQANGERIEAAMKTKNEALADMYKKANVIYAAEGAQGVAGLAIGGFAIVSAKMAGATWLTAVGAPAGLIMLPIAVAVGAAGYTYRKAERATETWMRTSEDWRKALPDPESLLEKLKELGTGKRGEGQSLVFGFSKKADSTIEGANAEVRRELTQAYVTATSNPQPEGGLEQYVKDQMEFHHLHSHGTYDLQEPAVYRLGRKYAEFMARERDLKTEDTETMSGRMRMFKRFMVMEEEGNGG